MTTVVDANVMIDALRGRDAALQAIRAVRRRRGELVSPTTTRAEVLAGLKPGEERRTDALFRLIDWIPVTSEIADVAGTYARRYKPSHPGIDLSDYLLAATADVLGGTLLTLNVRHFPMFPDLQSAY